MAYDNVLKEILFFHHVTALKSTIFNTVPKIIALLSFEDKEQLILLDRADLDKKTTKLSPTKKIC